MTAVFEKIAEMSLTASAVVLVVLVIRLLLKKAPRKYSYALWAAAAFRLVCPVSFRSVFSIFTLTQSVKLPEGGQGIEAPPVTTVAPNVMVTTPPAVSMPPAAVTVPPSVTVMPPAVTEPIAPPVSFWDVAAVIWLVVLAGLLIYGAVSYVRMRRRMASAILLEGNVYRSDRVRSPFILGFVRPKIYLPFGLTAEQQTYVLAHERYHIRRLDHIVRPVAFLILCVHWFNPLVWLAYYLMGRDMEMSCDEKVLGGADNIRKAYSLTLLSFAANRRFPSPSPLAFGETGVKSRIKNVLNWKKPALWVTIIAVIVVIAVILVCAADPREPSDGITREQEGEYRTVECIYLTPLSSYYAPDGDDGYDYTITSNHVTRGDQQLKVTSDWEELTEDRWNDMDFLFRESVLKERVGGYRTQRILTLSNDWYLMEMDGELWIAQLSQDPNSRTYFWSIYRMEKEGETTGEPVAKWMSTVTAEDITRIEADSEGTSSVIYSGENKYLDPLGNQKAQALVKKLNALPEEALKEAGSEEWRIALTVECGRERYILRLSDDGVGLSHGESVWIVDSGELDTMVRGLAADALGWDLVYRWERYATAECLYLDPASSVAFTNLWGKGTPHQIGPTHIIAYASFDIYFSFPKRMGAWEPVSEERWESMFTGEHPLPYSALSDPMIRSAGQGTWLMRTGEKLWLLDMNDGDPDKVWAVFRLERAPEASFEAPTGWFRTTECVYMSPLSSSIPMNGDSGFTYGIEGDALTLVHNGSRPTLGDSTGHSYSYRAESSWQELTEEMWREMTEGTLFLSGGDLWDTIGQYGQRYIRRYEAGCFLLSLDGEVWVGESNAHPNGEQYLWDLWRLTPADAPEITVEKKAAFTADLNHDGAVEFLNVTYDHVNETYKLTVSESIGMNVLLEWEFHRMGTLNAGYYLYSREGKDYLLWWEPYCQQGVWHLFYEVFSFGEGGSHVELASGVRQYDASHIGMEHLTADLEDLRAFEREINALLANSVPLLVNQTAEGGGILIGGQGGPILWTSPADDWEARRQYEQEKQTAREKATLAVWPLNDLTVTLLKADESDDPFYTLDVFGSNDYFFWETQFHRLNHNLLYFRYEEGGVQYLMELSVGGGQGTGIWSYRVFSVLPESLEILRENSLTYDAAHYHTMLTVDTAALRAFEAEVNGLLERAVLIGGVDDSKLVYNTPDKIDTVYRMDTGMAELIEGNQAKEKGYVAETAWDDLPEFVRESILSEVKKLGTDREGILAVEYFNLGTASLTMENTLWRVTWLSPTAEPQYAKQMFYIGFHRDWDDASQQEYCLGTMTGSALVSAHGPFPPEDETPFREALQDLFDRWRTNHTCLCGSGPD